MPQKKVSLRIDGELTSALEGQTILLCWKLGEKGVTHWHNTTEGFAGRKPIDERIIRGQKKSN